MFAQRFILCLIAICQVHSFKLPDYIKLCSISDPEIGNCLKDRMTELLPRFVKGNPALRIPSLAPFHLDEIVIEATKSLTLKLSDIDIYGIENAKVVSIITDMKKMRSKVDMLFPLLNVIATYDVDGQIMVLPIKGHGPLNITTTNAEFHLEFTWELEKKNGVDYGKLGDAILTYKTEKTRFKFDNLFNGNKELGDQVNNFLNDNEKDLSKDIAPAVSDTINAVIMGIFRSVSGQVPYNKLFLP